jgi:hypothetical protein
MVRFSVYNVVVVLFVYSSFAFVSWYALYVMLPVQYPNNDWWYLLNRIFIYILIITSYTFHILATFLGPGNCTGNVISGDVISEVDHHVDPRNGDEFSLYCEKCKKSRPVRSHHCKICGKCVPKMDHHCVWIGDCVGAKNHRFFYLFLIFFFISAVYVFSQILPILWYPKKSLGNYGSWWIVYYAITAHLAGLSLVVILYVGNTIIWQTGLIRRNITTVEVAYSKTLKKLKNMNYENLFDKGVIENVVSCIHGKEQ